MKAPFITQRWTHKLAVPASLWVQLQELHSNKRGDSMRSAARLKMGYYPLPESEGTKLRALLSFANPASVIDPCVGQGTALNLVTQRCTSSTLWD